MGSLSFLLTPSVPFRMDLTVWALRRRPYNAVDRWDGKTYRRAFLIDEEVAEVSVEQEGPPEQPALRVWVGGSQLKAGKKVTRTAVTSALERLLGLHLRLDDFYAMAERDPRLRPLARRFKGFKPPRYASLFEALVNAISCQQITLSLGIHLLNRIAEKWGSRALSKDDTLYTLPQAAVLRRIRAPSLRGMGLSTSKAVALIETARAFSTGALAEEGVAALDDASAVEYLTQVRGIGRWSAEYALLRGLGRLSIFPSADSGALNNLRRFLGWKRPLNAAQGRQILEKWSPYAGLVYFHLLLKGLADAGYIP
jgi:DNA-3-methyladenine glycosylase II